MSGRRRAERRRRGAVQASSAAPTAALSVVVTERGVAGALDARLAGLDRQAAIAPGRTEFRVYAGQALLALGRVDEARRAFAAVVAVSQDNVAANLGLVDCQLAAGSVDEAADRLSRLLEEDPGCSAYRLRLADLLVAAGELEAAASLLGDGMHHGPREAPLYARLGHVLSRLGRQRDAVYAYAVALAVAPTNLEARQGLVEAQRSLAWQVPG